MSDPLVRRFSRFQIAMHWLIAVPYLTLVCSGALLVLQRLGLFEGVAGSVISRVHRCCGVALIFALVQLAIVASIGGRTRAILSDYLDSVLIRPRDLIWLLVVPLNALWPRRFHLPPAGRFNVGQRLHALFVSIAVASFVTTGVMMMARPADLRPWIVHCWLFLAAALFLSLHLFLGLINPSTRRALGGIFTGFVLRQYAEEHHALTLGEPLREPAPHAVVSLRVLLATVALVMVGATLLVWWYGPQRSAAEILHLSRREHPAIFPGALAASHADDPRTARCKACHESLKPPSNSACLACHPEIAQVMRERTGYHGQLAGTCRACHPDHLGRDADIRGLDPRAFNHRLARFPLQGRHGEIDCDRCHLHTSGGTARRQYIQMTFGACVDCHVNPHQDPGADDCTRCHNEQGWHGRSVLFDHQRDTAFHLDGRHTQVGCEKCHSGHRASTASATSPATRPAFLLTGIGRACADCHADPHQPSLGNDCERCHTTEGWTGSQLVFHHDRDSEFRLEAAHAAIKCEACHKLPSPDAALARAQFVGLSTQCEGCHVDPHAGQFHRECTACHTQVGWTGRQLLFQHDRDSRFQLRGRHAQTDCLKCHKPARTSLAIGRAEFTGTPEECGDCHKDPHEGQFDKVCAACHTEWGWREPLVFDHNRDSRFGIDAIHADLQCAACHRASEGKVVYRPLPTSCEECHTFITDAMAGKIGDQQVGADPHAGRVRCLDCHPTDSTALDRAVLAGACVKCHNPRYAVLSLDWQRSLDERAANVRRMLSQIRSAEPVKAAVLARQLDEVRRVGTHNTQAAVKMLDELGAGRPLKDAASP